MNGKIISLFENPLSLSRKWVSISNNCIKSSKMHQSGIILYV